MGLIDREQILAALRQSHADACCGRDNPLVCETCRTYETVIELVQGAPERHDVVDELLAAACDVIGRAKRRERVTDRERLVLGSTVNGETRLRHYLRAEAELVLLHSDVDPLPPEEAERLADEAERGYRIHCPDDGRCHHGCLLDGPCFRVLSAGPLTAAGYPGDRWPADLVAEHRRLAAESIP